MAARRRREFLFNRYGRELAVEARRIPRRCVLSEAAPTARPCPRRLSQSHRFADWRGCPQPADYTRRESPDSCCHAGATSGRVEELSVHLWLVALDDALLLVSHERKHGFALPYEPRASHLL